MLKQRSVVFLAWILALAGLLAVSCGSDNTSDATAPAPPPVAEPAPAPSEVDPPPAPPEQPREEASPTTATVEEPPAASSATTSSPTTTAPTTTAPTTTVAVAPEPPSTTSTTVATAEEEPAGLDARFPVTIDSDAGTWMLEQAPQRIVSLSPTATETLFAVGAGPQVVAADSWSTFPPEAPTTDLSAFNPNVEAITTYDPDLVVISYDTNDLVASLTALEIPVLMSTNPADIEGGYTTMTQLATATGHVEGAQEVIESMRTAITETLASAPDIQIRVYHELDNTYYSASSNGFVGSVYSTLGVINIADEADVNGSGFPQLTEEYIIEADPQLIVITDQTGYTAEDVAARPGWDSISAVREGNILMVNADIASRWGPRLPQFLSAVTEALTEIAATAP